VPTPGSLARPCLPEPPSPTRRLGSGTPISAPAQGVILVNGQRLAVGDGIAAIDEPELTITAEEDAELVPVDAA
jgi:hypothetical protein